MTEVSHPAVPPCGVILVPCRLLWFFVTWYLLRQKPAVLSRSTSY
jgi:hypothetical protein